MKCLATLCLMLCCVLPAFSQITLTENDIQALIGTTHEYITYSLDEPANDIQALINMDGANQTWDFTTLPFDEDESVRSTKTIATEAPADAPGHNEAPFNQADYVIIDEIGTDSVSYDFLQSGADGAYFLGTTSAHGTNSEVRSTYHSPILILPLPATYGDTWMSNATFTLIGGGNTDDIEETLDNEMDGYGTLMLPHGSFEVLRQKQEMTLVTPFVTTNQTHYFYYTKAFDVVAGISALELPFGTYYLASYNSPADGGGGTATPPATAPADLSPDDNATEQSTALTLAWSPVGDATGYHLQVATDAAFTTLIVDDDTLTTTAYEFSDLDPSTTYYWQVRATNSAGNGPFSDAHTFTTASTNTATEDPDVPATFHLHANYPNPFNPSTEIRFDLHRPATVSLVVTDLTGRIVAHLADESLPAGPYRYTFDAAHLASGLYLYRLTAGSQTNTRPMLLVK